MTQLKFLRLKKNNPTTRKTHFLTKEFLRNLRNSFQLFLNPLDLLVATLAPSLIPSQLNRLFLPDLRPATVATTTNLKPKHYHFDLKLKPESVPQWDGNPDNLARWMSKINHLANNSPEIKEELGKKYSQGDSPSWPKLGIIQFQTQRMKGLKKTGPLLKRLFQNIG